MGDTRRLDYSSYMGITHVMGGILPNAFVVGLAWRCPRPPTP